MGKKRTYGEACGIPRALDRVGERWALLIVRELILGPKRFTDIRDGLPGLSPDVLSQRLRELEEAKIVGRRELPPPAASKVYELTEWGRELEDVLLALGRWGAKAPGPPAEACMSFDSHILSLRTLFDPARAGDLEATVELRLAGRAFRADVSDGRLEIGPGEAPSAAATIEADPGMLLAVVHGRLALDEALREGDLKVAGDKRVARRFLGLFPLPEPAAA
jgi:DNA-binding HxlR family transcriptional regulator